MPLDLAPIQDRLALVGDFDSVATPAVRGFGESDAYSGFGEVLVWSAKEGVIPPLATFIAAAPADIAALIEEVERLRNEVDWWCDKHDAKANDLEQALAEAAERRWNLTP